MLNWRMWTLIACATGASLLLGSAKAEGSFAIPRSWHLLYEVQPPERSTRANAQPSAEGFQRELAAVDVLGEFVAFEVQTWQAMPPMFHISRRLRARRLHLLNSRTGTHDEVDLRWDESLKGTHFLGQSGSVLAGTNVICRNLRQRITIPCSSAGEPVARLADGDFVVNQGNSLCFLDLSTLANGEMLATKLANPAPSLAKLILVGRDFILGWSAISTPYDIVLFSRETGQVVWKDRARGYLLGVGDEYAYMWSYRIESARTQDVLVRKQLKEPYRAESTLVPMLRYTAGVIDFCWPDLMLLVREREVAICMW